jgi:hypothetical protein
MGKVNADQVYNLIQNYWTNRNIAKASNNYYNFDYYDLKYKYELRSRRCNHNKNPTMLIPEMKCNKNFYLLFLFNDGLYYIRYNKSKFKKYDKKILKKNVFKNYYLVPIIDLKKIQISNEEKKIENSEFYIYFD